MMDPKSAFKSSITVGFMNIKGQSRLNTEKQLQIEAFLKQYKCDILHLQETNIEQETFSTCSYICNNYDSIILYLTCSLCVFSIAHKYSIHGQHVFIELAQIIIKSAMWLLLKEGIYLCFA